MRAWRQSGSGAFSRRRTGCAPAGCGRPSSAAARPPGGWKRCSAARRRRGKRRGSSVSWLVLPSGRFFFCYTLSQKRVLKSVPAKIHKFCFFHNSASDRRPFLQDFVSLPSFPVRRSCILPPLPV